MSGKQDEKGLLSSIAGAFWKPAQEDEASGESSPQPTSSAVPPMSVPTLPTLGSAVTVDPEVLSRARTEVFDIAGSPFARFAQECKKLESVLADPAVRMKAALATSGLSATELVSVLQTTHSAALEGFKQEIERARTEKANVEITGREQKLQNLETSRQGIEEQIRQLQQKLQENATEASVIQGEIVEQQSQIDARAKTFEAATQAVAAELAQTVATLKTLG